MWLFKYNFKYSLKIKQLDPLGLIVFKLSNILKIIIINIPFFASHKYDWSITRLYKNIVFN